MKIKLSPRSSKGFTLIELIIVIAILVTLAGIAYPTYMSIQENAGRTAAKKACVDIVNAVESFKQDNNGMLPYNTDMVEPDDNDQMYLVTAAGQDADLIKVLTDREDEDAERRLNTTRDIYLRSDEQDQPREGLFINASGEVGYYDPWGMPYYIVLCEEDAGAKDPFTSRRYRGKNCLVYSTGPDQSGVATTDSAPVKKPKGNKAQAAAAAAAAEQLEEELEDNVFSWKNQK